MASVQTNTVKTKKDRQNLYLFRSNALAVVVIRFAYNGRDGGIIFTYANIY